MSHSPAPRRRMFLLLVKGSQLLPATPAPTKQVLGGPRVAASEQRPAGCSTLCRKPGSGQQGPLGLRTHLPAPRLSYIAPHRNKNKVAESSFSLLPQYP